MNKYRLRRYVWGLGAAFVLSSASVVAVDDSDGGPVRADDAIDEMCGEEVIISYFPEEFVRNTLKSHEIPQDKWDLIVADLKNKNGDVINIVEGKAEAMEPNPLKDPNHRTEAIAVFREALLTTFTNVMNKHGVTDEDQIQKMLDDVQMQKAKRFSECLEKHMQKMQPGDAQPSEEEMQPNGSKTEG